MNPKELKPGYTLPEQTRRKAANRELTKLTVNRYFDGIPTEQIGQVEQDGILTGAQGELPSRLALAHG